MRNDGTYPRDHCLRPRRYATIFSVLYRTHLRWPGRDQKNRRDLLEFFPLVCIGVTTVSAHRVFISVQQPVYLRDFGHMHCRTVNVDDKARLVLHATVRLHPERPLIARRRLMQLRITLTAAVRRRTRRSNPRRIAARPAAQAQSLAGKMGDGLGKSLRSQLVGFEPTAKI